MRILSRKLERVHYIQIPSDLKETDIPEFKLRVDEWRGLDVDMHVIDVKSLKKAPHDFFNLVRDFSRAVAPKKIATLNVTEDLYREIVTRKLTTAFNRVNLFPDDLMEKRRFADPDMRRLLIRYLIRAAYAAVEVTLNSTVSCDENYVAKAERVPYTQFDLISIIDVKNDFLKAQFRLCSSAAVLKRAASAMLGDSVTIDNEMVESMSSELLNLIYGKAKSQLNDKEGFNLPAAIPRVLYQKEFDTITRSASPDHLSILPLVTPLGSFYVEVDTGIPA